jgi:hypothetical protein
MTPPVYQLYADGTHYDSIFEDSPSKSEPEIAFYRDMAAQPDGSVLELACGTGRLAIPLAAPGSTCLALTSPQVCWDRRAAKRLPRTWTSSGPAATSAALTWAAPSV